MALLLNGMFCGDSHGLDFTPTNVNNINNITISNGIYDDLFISKNVIDEFSEDNKIWDFNTMLYALFQNNLYGGNVLYSAETVSAIRIKRRKKGNYTWDILFEIPIHSNQDLQFERFDRFARSKIEYEYALVPVLINGNTEGNLNINSIESKFEGIILVEKDTLIRAYYNAKLISKERVSDNHTIKTKGKRTPFSIKSGESNYTVGKLEATFFDVGLNGEELIEDGWKFRELVNNFLCDGKPKVLKNSDGQLYLVSIVNNIPEDYNLHELMPITTISWEEIGDAENVDDLYDSNLIDVDSRLIR
jgi:hypothetical protein